MLLGGLKFPQREPMKLTLALLTCRGALLQTLAVGKRSRGAYQTANHNTGPPTSRHQKRSDGESPLSMYRIVRHARRDDPKGTVCSAVLLHHQE